jgi:hypothetical protein
MPKPDNSMSKAELLAHLSATGQIKSAASVGPPAAGKRGEKRNVLDDEIGRADATAVNIFTTPPAFTLLQPFASLLSSGARRLVDVERYVGYRGRVFIYASSFDRNADSILEQYPDLADALDVRKVARLPAGHVVGTAILESVYRIVDEPAPGMSYKDNRRAGLNSREIYASDLYVEGPIECTLADFSPGRFVLAFDDARLFDEPVPLATAGRGFFELPAPTLSLLKPLFE